jgi:UDP-N-acetyl-D-glucosamine dehydrogenase
MPLKGRRSATLTEAAVATYDALVICTDHDAIDYEMLARSARLIVDSRNALPRRHITGANLVKA